LLTLALTKVQSEVYAGPSSVFRSGGRWVNSLMEEPLSSMF